MTCHKQRHRTRRGARHELRKLLRRCSYEDRLLLHVYKCSECGGFHVGRSWKAATARVIDCLQS